MPPALAATARAWSNARSPSVACGVTAAASPTSITEHAARFQEPSQSETPTQLACPLRSRYVWNGKSTPRQGARRPAARYGEEPEKLPVSKHGPQRRYSSFEAYVVDGEVLDGENGWTSPTGSHQSPRRFSGSGGGSGSASSGSSGSCDHVHSRSVSGAGSSLRPGGRSNLFFGADYSGGAAHLSGARSRADGAAAKLPSGTVDPKAAAVLGVAGSVSGVASKAQKLLGVGRREGEEGQAEVLALQDAESPKRGSGAASTSPRKDDAPPGFEPLGAEGEEDAPASDTDDASKGCSMAPSGRADADVQVGFPADFDDGRKETTVSDSDDSSGKPQSGASLGTKSGSTSLLSMLSGSPRSLGTANETASGSLSPRTPLSDHSSADGAAAAAAATAPRPGHGSNRGADRSGAPRNRDEPWIATRNSSGIGGEGGGSDADESRRSSSRGAAGPRPQVALPEVTQANEDGDDCDVPSAHPTPLSAFGGDLDLPSDHPTPLSTMGSKSKGSGRSKEKEAAPPSSSTRHSSTAGGGTSASEKSLNPSAGSFMQRLKYWSANSENASKSRETTAGRAGSVANRLRSSGSGNSSIARAASGRANVRRSRDVVESAAAASARSSLPNGRRLGHGESELSSSSLDSEAGVKIMPYDSVTSDAASVFMSASSKQPWRTVAPSSAPPPAPSSLGSVSRAESPPPYRPPQLQQPSSSSRHRGGGSSAKAQSRGSSVSKTEPAAEEEVDPIPPSSAGSGSDRLFAPDIDIGSALVSPAPPKAHASFGASHREELAALRLARGTPAPGESEIASSAASVAAVSPAQDSKETAEIGVRDDSSASESRSDSEQESEMDWDAVSDDEGEEKVEEDAAGQDPVVAQDFPSVTADRIPIETEEDADKPLPPPSVERLSSPPLPVARRSPAASRAESPADDAASLDQHDPPAPPRYMAIVESANVKSALDHSSTSEVDTSPSEDDGGMMAEILTDRLMEVCNKMEAVAATPSDELSDGDGAGSSKRRQASRRARQHSSMSASSRTFTRDQGSFFAPSTLPTDADEKFLESDEESVLEEGAAARKLRRDRIRKRARAQSRRKVASALTVPTDSKGNAIDVHTAAYNGHTHLVTSFINQGGELEVRDQFQATALMLASERGHTVMVDALLEAGADVCGVDENGNSALHLACFYGNTDVVKLLLGVDADVQAVDSEGRSPLDLATDPTIRRMVKTEQAVRMSGERFDLLEAVEVNDIRALNSFIMMGQEACGYPGNPSAVAVAAERLKLNRRGRGGMSAVHLAAFHGYSDVLRVLLDGGADPNAVCDDGETPLHTACTGGSTVCATILLEHGANPLATDAKGLVPCEKHIAGGRHEMKRLLERKAFQATPANLMALRADLAEVALQIDAEEDLFVRKGVAIKYLRRALKKKETDTARLRQVVELRDTELRNLADRMDSVHRLLTGASLGR